MERREIFPESSPFHRPSVARIKQRLTIDMIRLFNVFCKLNFLIKTAKQLFDESVLNVCISDLPCPLCGSRQPNWSYFDSYTRYLISYEYDKYKDYIVSVPRYLCSSCGHTHALIPEIAIPYSSYSIIFILNVLKDRFLDNMSVAAICQKYVISVSTYYRWKKLYEQNRLLWLGVLEKITSSSGEFLNAHPSKETSTMLYIYWQRNGLSFLQQSLHREKIHFDIRLRPPPAYSPAFYIR